MFGRLWALLCRLVLLLALLMAGLGLWVLSTRQPLFLICLAAGVAWVRRQRLESSGWSHGTARAGSMRDLTRGRMLSATGLLMGTAELVERPNKLPALVGLAWPFRRSEDACRAFLASWCGAGWQADLFIRIKHHVHVATFAKTGAGKGVSLVVPNLLSHRGAVVVTDIKGELWNLTAEHRRRRMGHQTIRLDPLGIAGPAAGSATMNSFDWIDETSDEFLDQCRELSGQIVVKSGKELDDHWVESARVMLTAFIAFVCGCEADRSLRNMNTVRILISSRVAYDNALLVMQAETDACQGVIARLGHICTCWVDRELGSILSTVQRFTEFCDSPAIQRHIASSSFDPRILKSGRVSIYCCLSHHKIDSLAPLQRMWLATILSLLTKGEASEKHPVLFVLDECAHLGRLEIIERSVTLLRGYGIRLWFFFQSIGQVRKLYGDNADVILGNIGTQQFFSISDFASAEAISNRIGETTIAIRTGSRSRSLSRPFGGSGPEPASSRSITTSTNTSDIARKLIRPEEIMTMDEDLSLLFHNNLPVVQTRLIRYFDHPAFRGGRTGRQPRLGFAAGMAAIGLLLLSVAFFTVAARLPVPVVRTRMAAAPVRQPRPTLWQPPRRAVTPGGRRLPPRYPASSPNGRF